MLLPIVLTLLAAALSPLLRHISGRWGGWIASVLPAGLFVFFLSQLPTVQAGGERTFSVTWIPSLGISLAFRLDGLSLLFALLIAGVGTLVVIYAGGYLGGHPHRGRFYAFLFLFMSSMLGVVLADNLFLLFVFWELTSVASFLLIGFSHEKEEARRSALQALLITGLGGLAMMAGFILIAIAGGTSEVSELLSRGDLLRSHELYLPALLLLLLGAFTKSAQAPFHFWLPGAMAAPAPVSAYLHSATMVKAGVYLLARLNPALGGTDEWHYLLTLAGGATMVIGALLAGPQTDLKRLLGYSTVSALGMLVMLIGLSTDLAAKAALVFLVVHSLYKAALFMVAGTIDHETGTRDVRQLHGLMRVMPFTAIAAVLAALSMTGFPPLLGFIGKELMYEAKMQAPSASLFLLIAGVLANAVNIAVAILSGMRPFIGRGKHHPAQAHEGTLTLWLGPLILGLSGLLLGLFPDLIGIPLIEPAVRSVRAEHVDVDLALWHGINPVLLLSILTIVVGVVLYLLRHRARDASARLRVPELLLPGGVYRRMIAALPAFSGRLVGVIHNGNLRSYLFTIITVFLILAARTFVDLADWPVLSRLGDVEFYSVGLVVLMIAATLMVVASRTRLAAVAALGVLGFGIAALYVIYSAPDLAITQILVETLTVVIFLFVIRHLPRFGERSPRPTQFRDGVIAVLSGTMVALFSLKASGVQMDSAISSYFAENSVPAAYGRNVVNVILVDFRALDTLGEATVLAVAAIGVYAMIKLRKHHGRRAG
ncbi:MAG: putative monovalent cation/H+ antiporter subunit A [Bacteroidetes bacterium]|nr:putative monovalent cation/H+ antiporter subunit A [Bacteroidota bacterium]